MPATPSHGVRAIAEACLLADSPSQLESVLDRECGGDEGLRDAVVRWLRRHGEHTTLHQMASNGDAASSSASSTDGPQTRFIGSNIGPFHIVSHIASGGFGEIYLADQQSPVRRRVAVKVIKLGMDSAEVIARFEAERQALALMAHPNVASVFDGGTTADGRPYFAMEFVDGIQLIDYCNQHRLSIRSRLGLFLGVCRGVEHAHQKGIIHRDLKPSNVLVTTVDGHPMAKVIDFGVAKALGPNLVEVPLRTAAGQLIGTPMYMSPEQANIPAHDVDVRSDVYSLGVLLYELLVGAPPFSRRIIKDCGLDEMRRLVREVDPPRPSARLASFSQKQRGRVSKQRFGIGNRLLGALRIDLDWIVMRALEKDRQRRYPSVNSLASDIERYLNRQPVEACPPSWLYRTKKVVQRHARLLSAATVLTVILFAAVVTSLLHAWDASHARKVAFRAQLDAERAAERSRELLYAGDMLLAGYAAQRNDVELMRELLRQHIPKPGDKTDLRGFEWHFLWKGIDIRPHDSLHSVEPLYFVCTSPDERLLATAGKDGTIRLLRSGTLDLVRELPSGQREVNGLAFSPDATRLASVGDDGSVRLWDVASGKLIWQAETGGRLAFQVAFTPDGKLVASCGVGKAVQFWNAVTGERTAAISYHDAAIECLTISSNGLLVTGSADESAQLVDLNQPDAGGAERYSPQHAPLLRTILNLQQGPVSCVGVSGDNRMLVFGQLSGLMTVYDIAEQSLVYRHMFPNGIQSIAVSTGNASRKPALVVGDRDGNVHLIPFDLVQSANGAIATHGSRTRIQTWRAHTGRVYSVAFQAGGDQLITAGEDGRLRVWNLGYQEHRGTVLEAGSYFTLIGNERLVLETQHLPIYGLRTGRKSHNLADGDQQWVDICAARNEGTVIAQSRDGGLYGWRRNGEAMGQLWKTTQGSKLGSFAISDDGRWFIFVDTLVNRPSRLVLIDLRNPTRQRTFHESSIGNVAISRHGKYAAFASLNDLYVIDVQSATIQRKWSDQHAGIYDIQFSPDERSVATIAGDRTLKVHSIANGSTLFSVIAHENAASTLAFSPDGNTIATAGLNGMLRLWRWQIGRMVLEIPTNNWPVTHVEFTPDGNRIVSHETNCISMYDGSRTAETEPTIRPNHMLRSANPAEAGPLR